MLFQSIDIGATIEQIFSYFLYIELPFCSMQISELDIKMEKMDLYLKLEMNQRKIQLYGAR